MSISSESQRRGILQMTAAEYFDLWDKSGRMTRSNKRGAIDADLAPILLRIGAIQMRGLIQSPDSDPISVSPPGCFPICAICSSNRQPVAQRGCDGSNRLRIIAAATNLNHTSASAHP